MRGFEIQPYIFKAQQEPANFVFVSKWLFECSLGLLKDLVE